MLQIKMRSCLNDLAYTWLQKTRPLYFDDWSEFVCLTQLEILLSIKVVLEDYYLIQ